MPKTSRSEPHRAPVTLHVSEADGPPIDLGEWVRMYVAEMMALEASADVADEPRASVG